MSCNHSRTFLVSLLLPYKNSTQPLYLRALIVLVLKACFSVNILYRSGIFALLNILKNNLFKIKKFNKKNVFLKNNIYQYSINYIINNIIQIFGLLKHLHKILLKILSIICISFNTMSNLGVNSEKYVQKRPIQMSICIS